MLRTQSSRHTRFKRYLAVLLSAALVACGGGGGGSAPTNTGTVTTTTGPLGIKASQMSDGALYFTGTYQGQPLKISHQGATGAGTWIAYEGTATARIRYTMSDTAGLQEVLAMDTGERMTVQTVGNARVEYRSYSNTGVFEWGVVLWQVNQHWWMARMPTEAFRDYGELIGPTDVTATIAPALATTTGPAAAGLNRPVALRVGSLGLLPQMSWSEIKKAGMLAFKSAAWSITSGVAVGATMPVAGTAVVTVAGSSVIVPAAIFVAGVWMTAQGLDAFWSFYQSLQANQEPVSTDPDPQTQADYQTQTRPTTATQTPTPIPPSPVSPDPVVKGVTPVTAIVGQPVTLVISGTDIGGYYGVSMQLPGCANLTPMGHTATTGTFECTPSAVGTLSGTVNDPISSALLYSFSLNVTNRFTKISADGQDLPDDATIWACVRHNVTGLLWEAHVLRGTDTNGVWFQHTCSWDSNKFGCIGYTNMGNGNPWDASAVPATVGTLCGITGWRLPTVGEGTALVNDPAYKAGNNFKSTWFGSDDVVDFGWTSSPPAGSSGAWDIGFSNGSINYEGNDGGNGYSARLVR
ncbi:MAG: DUF1566 domain-containing protein [Leptothrix sp. (in: b-proteobacteria)]